VVSEVLVWALLGLGGTVQLLAVIGVLVAGDVYDRLHFTGPASIFAPLALALAVVIDEGPLSQAGLKSALVALLLMALSPILVHATARAARIRERGGLEIVADEAGVEQ
jgi:monovalent cation/proton antiporter MnhG/PhaG subunit